MKAPAIIILILIFPLFFLALFGLSMKYTLQQPGFLKNELKSQNAYVKINQDVPEIVNAVGANKDNQAGSFLPNADLASLIQTALTPDLLQQSTESFLDGLSSVGQSNATNAPQTQLANNINAAIKAKYEALPVCESAADLSGLAGGDFSCRQPGVTFDQVMAQLSAQGNNPLSAADNVSGALSPAGAQNQNAASGPSLSSISQVYRFANLTYILPVILALIILLAARLFAGSWLGAGKIFGIFLAVMSLLALLFNLLLAALIDKPIASFISGFASSLPKLKTELITPLVNDILGKVSNMTSTISIVSIGLGIIFFIGFWAINKFLVKKPEAA